DAGAGAVEDAHEPAGFLADDHVHAAIAVDVAGRNGHAARVVDAKGEVGEDLLVGGAAVDAHPAAAAPAADEQVGLAVAVDVAGGHVNAAAEVIAERREGHDRAGRGAVEDADASVARAGGHEQVGHPVARDIAGRDAHAVGGAWPPGEATDE